MDVAGLVQQRAQLRRPPLPEEGSGVAADLQHADDVVDAALVHGQAAVVRPVDGGQDLLVGGVGVQSREIYPGREHPLHGDVAEFQGGVDQLSLPGVQISLVGHGLDDVIELVLGDGDLRLALEDPRRHPADGAQRPGQGGENAHKKAQGRGHGQRAPFTVSFGYGFRQHLPGKKHSHSADDRTQRHPLASPGTAHHHRGQRSGGQMHDIRPDQQRGNSLIEAVQHGERLVGPSLSPVGTKLEPDAAHRSHGGLGQGKISCHSQQKDYENPRQPTVAVHEG